MSKRTVLTYPNAFLKKNSEDVSLPLKEEDCKLIEDLKDTCTVEGGVGISAPQVGINKNIIIVTHDGELKALINPEIISFSADEIKREREGCLSFPGLQALIKRYESIKIKYYNEEGVIKLEDFHGFTARIVQHEIDHLTGVLMIDRMHRLEKQRFIKKQKREHKKFKNMIKQMMSNVK